MNKNTTVNIEQNSADYQNTEKNYPKYKQILTQIYACKYIANDNKK